MNKEEILDLIELGFDPKIIESELGVSVETIQKYINEDKIEHSRPKAITTSKPKTQLHHEHKQVTLKPTYTPSPSYKSRLDILREKYKQLYKANSQIGSIYSSNLPEPPMPTPEETEENEKTLQILEKALEKAKATPRSGIYQILDNDLKEPLMPFFQKPKTLKQASQVTTILNDKIWDSMAFDQHGKRKAKLGKLRKLGYQNLSAIADSLINHTNDLNKLEEIYHLLLSAPTYDLSASSVRTRITNKISDIRNYQTIYNMRHNISPDIQKVILSIGNGTFDLEESKKAVDAEAQKRYDTSSKNKFSLTKERHEKQVLIQIRSALAEQGKLFPITNIESAIQAMHELDPSIDSSQMLHIVANNLIAQKQYPQATEFCEKFVKPLSLDEDRTSISQIARNQRRQIVFHEIGQTLLERMELPTSREEDNQFMDSLERRLKSNKINLSAIPLGMNEAETKRITLADIWYKPNQRELK